MPKPLQSTMRAQVESAQYDRAIAARIAANRANRRGMRDITRSVESSPAMPGDTTHNADSVRKSRKSADKLESHADARAYVVSDTTVYQDDTLLAIKRSPSRLIVRNADGTPNDQDTLALIDRWRLYRASGR